MWGAHRREMLLSGLSGVALALHFAAWIPSLRMTSVAASTALVTTAPVWTLLLERWLGHRAPRGTWCGIALAGSGIVVITGADSWTGSGSDTVLLGNFLALAGGIIGAVYTVLGGRIRQKVSTATYTAVAYTSCALVLLPLCLMAGQPLLGFEARTWAELVGLTLIAQLLGHSALNRAVKAAGPTVVALVVLLEVPGATLLAWVFWGQSPPWLVLPGAVLLVLGLGVVLRARSQAGRATGAGTSPTPKVPVA